MIKIRVVAPPRPCRPADRAGHAAGGVPRQRHVDLAAVAQPRAATSTRSPRAPRQAGIETVFVKAADERRPLAAVVARARPGAARPRAAGVRVAVRLRREPRRRGGRRASTPSARAPTASSSTPSPGTRAATAQAQQYVRAAAAAVGAGLPVGLHELPVRRLPPEGPVLGVPRPRRRAGQPAAGLLEGHRRHRRRGERARRSRRTAIYERPIAPIGQTYQSPSAAELARFRAVWAGYGAAGLSWWSWQATERRRLGGAQPAGARGGGDARPGLAGARQGREGRPGHLAAAAPRGGRPGGRPSSGTFDAQHRPRAAELPDLARPAGHRHDRRRDVGRRCSSSTPSTGPSACARVDAGARRDRVDVDRGD